MLALIAFDTGYHAPLSHALQLFTTTLLALQIYPDDCFTGVSHSPVTTILVDLSTLRLSQPASPSWAGASQSAAGATRPSCARSGSGAGP